MKKTTITTAVAFLCFTCTALPQSANFATNLVAYYAFDENGAFDSSGNRNNGTIVGGGFEQDRRAGPGASLRLSAIGDSMNVPLAVLARYSVSVWFKWNRNDTTFTGAVTGGTGGFDVQCLISAHVGNGYNEHLIMVRGATGPALPNERVRFGFRNGDQATLTPYIDMPSSDYIHLAFVAEANRYTLYINGVQALFSVNFFTGLPMSLIGTDTFAGPHEAQTFGSFDDLRIFNRLLSADEVVQLYHLDLQPVAKTNNLPFIQIAVKRVRIGMYVEQGKTYQLEASNGLNVWAPFGEPYVASSAESYLDVDVFDGFRLFRIREVP